MTTPTTTASGPALELLQAAELAFDSGELRKGYSLVWEATMAALKPFATRMGFPCETKEQAQAFILDVDGIDEYWRGETYPYYFAAFNVAAMFQEQAEGAYDDEPEFRWEGRQFEFYLPAVKSLVKNLIEHPGAPPIWILNSTPPPLSG